MASIRMAKKFLKNSKGFLTIKIKDGNIEYGDTLFITPNDSMTFRRLGVVFSCAGIDYLHIPYWKFGAMWKESPAFNPMINVGTFQPIHNRW